MANKDVISSNSVTRWGEQPPPEEERLTEALLDDTAATPYPINEELNFKVALWQGDITKLQVDALINCNNEDLNERAGISGQIFVGAGPQMEEACAKLGGCPPGDAKATRGFRLPAKHVIHAVPPAWIDGGEGDAALEALYTKSLDVARRLTCATVACVPLKTKDVPREQAAHLAICAMRKRLESPEGKGIQLLVIAMRPQDVYDNMIYDNLLPLYFPRSGTEELEAARLLALHHQKNSGGAGAGAAANAPGGPTGGGAAPDFPYQPSAALAAVTQPPRANGGAGGVQGKDAAGRAVARGVVAAGGMPPSGSAYGSFLQRAGLADLSDLEALQLFYRAGVDARGRAVFLFWAGHLPSRPIDLERVLMLIMRTLDPYAHNEYILVYVHTTLAPENEPSFAWLRKVYDLFDARLKDNLYLMFVVHASWWLKMTMNFVRTFVSQRFWDDKLIMLDSFADLFKRNYFAPGSLRMPDSPLVRKYLETSGDAHMLDQLLPGAASARDARTDALAKAVASGALPGGDALPPGAPPASKAAVAMAAAERDGSGPGSAAARQLEQARASKEILLKQLIELSDQLAHAQGDKAAAERRMTATLAAKDGELNRLAQALADAQDKAEGASGRLAEVKDHREQMETQAQQRADILAEMSDLEGQLAQTQVYNDYMAKELHSVMGTLKREKWELLGEMSLLERQLLAAKQRGGGAPTGVSAEEEMAELKKAGAAARVDWAKVPEAAKGAMMIELSELASALRAERGAAEAAMGELGQQHADFGKQVQQASDELASIKRAEGQRAAEASARKDEMGAAVKVLEEKIAGVKSAAKRGASALSETRQADAKELEEIEQMLADAEGDIGNIQGSLGGEEAGGGLALVEMRALRTKLEADLASLPLRPDEAPAALVVVEERKEASMQAVAQQLVPQMNEVQRQHDESEAKLQASIDAVQSRIDDAESAPELARLEGQRDQMQRLHDLALEQLEAKASAALRSLEEQHAEEVARIQHDAAHAAGEQERLKARLAQLVPQIERAAADGGGERRGAAPDGAPDLAAARAGSKDASEWVAERLAFMLLEDSKNRQRSAMRRWQAMAEFKEGLELGAGVGGKSAAEAEALIAPLKLGMAAAASSETRALARAKTDKVRLLQAADAQAAQLEQASMALAVKTALDAGSQSAAAADAAARAMAEAAAEGASSMARQSAELAAAGAARAAAQVHELQRDLAETQERLRRERQEKESVLEHMQEAQQAAQRLALQAAERAAEHTARKMDDENWQRERRLRGELSAAEELARSRGEVASEAKLKEEAARRAASTEAATAREAADEAAAFAAKYQQAVEALQLEMGRGDEARRSELAARKEAVGAAGGPIAAAVTREHAEALLGAAAGLAGEAELDGGGGGGDRQAAGQLSARCTELEAALAAKQADLDGARRAASGAEARIDQLKQAGQTGVARISAQRELDEASAKTAEAEAELAELASRLAEMQPALARQRLSREMLRAQAESLLPQLAAANVGSLPLARSVIELMQERLQTLQGAAADAGRAGSREQAEAGRAEAAVMRAELQAKGREVELYREELRGARQQLETITAAPAGSKTEQLVQQAQTDEAARLREALADALVARGEAERQVAAARTEAEARPSGGGGVVGSVFGGGGAESERLASELNEMQARLDERGAELNLAQAEKTRLQRAVTDLKAGKMDAVYEQARQDAEKAVLDRMMASGFSFEQGR